MTIKIKKLDHVGIRVSDFTQTIKFYKNLGFNVSREDYNERVVVLKHSSGVEVNLLDNTSGDWQQKNILMDVESKHPGYTHFAIQVESVTEAKSYIESLGLRITEGPVTFGDGKTSIFIRDPDLNVIEFTEL